MREGWVVANGTLRKADTTVSHWQAGAAANGKAMERGDAWKGLGN